jgi:hypothetical protein
LRRNYETLRKPKFGALEGKLQGHKLKKLKCDLHWQQNMLTVATKPNEAAVQASFIIPKIFAEKSKPFTYCEYVKECVMKAEDEPCP